MKDGNEILTRSKAYVIIGYNPYTKELVAYNNNAASGGSIYDATYFIPDTYEDNSGRCYHMRRYTGYNKLSSNNQRMWFSLRYTVKWLQERWPYHHWRIYRANSKHCPVTFDKSKLYKHDGTEKHSFILPFKVKENFDLNTI